MSLLNKWAVKSIIFQKVDLLVYVFFIKRWFTIHMKAVIDMTNSYKGQMEREVAVYSEKNLPRDLEILITSPSYFKNGWLKETLDPFVK